MATRLQDPTGRWKKKCHKLADSLGYERAGVHYWWGQLALVRERFSMPRLDRSIHEEAAYRDCEQIFDKRGRAPD